MANRPSPGLSLAQYPVAEVTDYVICELKFDSQVALPPGAKAFSAAAPAAPVCDALNSVLQTFSVKQLAPLFGTVLKKKDFARRLAEPFAAPGISAPDPEFALAGFVAIVPQNPADCGKVAERLSLTPGVWKAYVAPRPEPAAMQVSRKKRAPLAQHIGPLPNLAFAVTEVELRFGS